MWHEFLSQSCGIVIAKPITFRRSNENRSRRSMDRLAHQREPFSYDELKMATVELVFDFLIRIPIENIEISVFSGQKSGARIIFYSVLQSERSFKRQGHATFEALCWLFCVMVASRNNSRIT